MIQYLRELAKSAWTEEEAQILDAEAHGAAFRIEHLFFHFGDQPVSWGWFIIAGKHLLFSMTVGTGPVAGQQDWAEYQPSWPGCTIGYNRSTARLEMVPRAS